MRPIHFFILGCYVIAALLFFLVGFDIVGEEDTEFNLVAIGLGSFVVGYAVDRFVE